MFLYDAPTGKDSSLSFSKGSGSDVYLLPAILTSGRYVCFYLGCGDLASLEGMLEEVHHVVRLPVVADQWNWLS